MKRIVGILLVLVMTVTCFCACETNEAGNSGDVRVVSVYTSDAGAKAVWDELVDEFNRTVGKEKGIKIEWTTYGTDYNSIMDVARQNNQLPDICTVSQSKMMEYIKTGDIVAIEDVSGGKEFLDEYDSIVVPGNNLIDGKLYRVYSGVNVPALIYNKDLFKKAGIVDENGEAKPPVTFAEAREYAKRITDKDKNIYGYSLPLKFEWGYTVSYQMSSAYGKMEGSDYDTLTYSFDNWKKPLEWILSLKEDGSLFPGAESLDNDTSRAYFAEGKIGMMAGISWDVGVLTNQFKAKCDWGVAPYPTEDGTYPYPRAYGPAGAYMLTKKALESDQDKVMEVFKFIFSKDTRQTMYERNISVSIKDDVLSDADESNLIPQFKKFAELYDENFPYKASPKLKIEGDSRDTVFGMIWSGEKTVDEGIAELNKRYSEALKKGVEDGSIDLSVYK